MKEYDAAWNAAITLAAKVVHIEAECCLADIVAGDVEGEKLAKARAGALFTAVDDIRALAKDGVVNK